MAEQADKVIIGRVAGLFGVKGWIKVQSYTEPATGISNYSPWLLQASGAAWQLLEPKVVQAHGKGFIAKLSGIEDRDAAAVFVRSDIVVSREQLPELSQGEYYWRDLEGLTVVNRNDVTLGTVDYLFETGANDVLVVRDGDREQLIPFSVGSVVLSVDLQARLVRVDWEPED